MRVLRQRQIFRERSKQASNESKDILGDAAIGGTISGPSTVAERVPRLSSKYGPSKYRYSFLLIRIVDGQALNLSDPQPGLEIVKNSNGHGFHGRISTLREGSGAKKDLASCRVSGYK